LYLDRCLSRIIRQERRYFVFLQHVAGGRPAGPGGFGGGGCAIGANNPDILSSVPVFSSTTNFYRCSFGTSAATPHVAGAFAAIRSARPNATVDQILTALQNTGLSVTDTRPGGNQTKPRIWVALAVQSLGCNSGPRTAHARFQPRTA
jgi:hypothetical protein